MSIWSSVKSAVSKVYNKVDSAVGGRLPAGVPSTSTSTSTSTKTSTTSSGGGSSGGGVLISSPSQEMIEQQEYQQNYISSGGGSSRGGVLIQEGAIAEQGLKNPVTNNGLLLSPEKEVKNLGLTQSALQINEKTGKPYGYLTPAPTTKEQYKSSIASQGFFSGSLSFLGEKSSGWLSGSKLSPVYESGYQASVGKLSSTTLQVAPYFVPFLGAGLMIGTGLEAVGTKAGRGRISTTSNILSEDYNIPKFVSTPAQYGINTLMIYGGAKSLIFQSERALGLPKIKTTPLGVQQTTQLEGGSQRITTDIFYKSDVTKLLGKNTYYGISRSITYATPLEEGKYLFGQTNTYGVFTEAGVKFPSGKIKILKPKQFNIISGSLSEEAKITEYFKEGGLKVSRELEGFKQASVGKGAVGKNILGEGSNFKKFQYISAGGGYNQKPTKIFGSTNLVNDLKYLEISKQGKGTYEGLIFDLSKSTSSEYGGINFIKSGGKKSSQEFFNQLYQPQFTGEVTKNLQASTSAIGSSKTISNFGARFMSPTLDKNSIKSSNNLILNKNTQQNKLFNQLNNDIKNNQNIIQDLSLVVKTNSKSKVKSYGGLGLAQVNIQTMNTGIKLYQPQIQEITQSNKQTSKLINIYKGLSITNIPPPIPIPFIPIIPVLPTLGLPSRGLGGGRIKIRRIVKYTPSYSAIIFGITGKQPKGIETGLRIRPITKGFSFSEMFNNPFVKRRVIKKRKIRRR